MSASPDPLCPPSTSPFIYKKQYVNYLNLNKVFEFKVRCCNYYYKLIAIKRIEETYWKYFGNESSQNLAKHPHGIQQIIFQNFLKTKKNVEKIIPIYVGKSISNVYIDPIDNFYSFAGIRLLDEKARLKNLVEASERQKLGQQKRRETMRKNIEQKLAARKERKDSSDEEEDEIQMIVSQLKERNNKKDKDGDSNKKHDKATQTPENFETAVIHEPPINPPSNQISDIQQQNRTDERMEYDQNTVDTEQNVLNLDGPELTDKSKQTPTYARNRRNQKKTTEETSTRRSARKSNLEDTPLNILNHNLNQLDNPLDNLFYKSGKRTLADYESDNENDTPSKKTSRQTDTTQLLTNVLKFTPDLNEKRK